MGILTQQVVIIVGLLAACFTAPAVAFAFMWRRKRRARASRRSPIGIDLLRSPGHTLREQLDKATDDASTDVSLLMFIPLLVLAAFLAQSLQRGGLDGMMHIALFYLAGATSFVAYLVHRLLKTGARVDNLKAGLDAELAVGQELNQLMRHGAVVFHDVPADNFNIDHVVIANEGVFAVETKGFTKRRRGRGKADAAVIFDGKNLKFPTRTTSAPLEQAQHEAAWLAKWLSSAVGTPVRVLPVVALPGWFVERTGRGDVRVFSGKELQGLLKSKGAQALSALDVQRISHQVEQRCRTVSPQYAKNEGVL